MFAGLLRPFAAVCRSAGVHQRRRRPAYREYPGARQMRATGRRSTNQPFRKPIELERRRRRRRRRHRPRVARRLHWFQGMAYHGIRIDLERAELSAILVVPPAACALVLFAHAAGRLSPRNRRVAHLLQERGIATLLLDLLTPDETCIAANDPALGFDVDFVTERLVQVTEWAQRDPRTASLPLCYFGASAWAAVALIAASRCSVAIRAVVSRTGRADLARAALPGVKAPSLLIVGGEDPDALAINRDVLPLFGGPSKLAIAPGATHTFSDPSALDVVAQLTADWLLEHLRVSIENGAP